MKPLFIYNDRTSAVKENRIIHNVDCKRIGKAGTGKNGSVYGGNTCLKSRCYRGMQVQFQDRLYLKQWLYLLNS